MARRLALKDYVPVAERIRAFYERYPEGSIQTEMVRLDEGLVIFKARVYRDASDPHPTTGWAYDRLAPGRRDGERVLESSETSAVGRALANLNFAGPRRPSREEIAEVLRLRRSGHTAAQRRGVAPGPAPASSLRRLLETLSLSADKRRRIEEKLAGDLTEQEAHELEAYLLAQRRRG